MAKRVFLTSKTVLAKSLAKKFLSIHFGVFGITISCQEPPILKKRFCLQQKKTAGSALLPAVFFILSLIGGLIFFI